MKDRSPQASSLLVKARRLLRRYGLRARKGLGQHFLVDEGVRQAIVSAAGLTPGDTVIEVGAGLGVMTGELAKHAGRVVAVELDVGLAEVLEQELESRGNVSVVRADILETKPEVLLGATESAGDTVAYKVVANLPYYIAAAVARHFLEAALKPRLMVVMVQKEVGETIVAQRGLMSLLSLSVQFYGRPEIVCYVPASSFFPPPKVDSVVLRIELYPQPLVADEKDFFGLARAGFSATRKQLINSLSGGLGWTKPEVLDMLEGVGIDPQRRAGTLTMPEWIALFREYQLRRGHADGSGSGQD